MKLAHLAFAFWSVTSFAQSEKHDLIGGKEVDPKDFPATVAASMGGGACTATVVGERTLLIAAHCVRGVLRASFSINGASYNSTCKMTPRYQQGIDHDLALCLVDKAVTGVPFEIVNLDSSLLKVGTDVQLAGLGCTQRNGNQYGTLRAAPVKISSLPNTALSQFDAVTTGQGILCPGDSGGAAFVYLDAAKKYRRVISTNSKTDWSNSYITLTSGAESEKFIREWASQNGQKICGVHGDAQGCRATADAPDSQPAPQPAPPQDQQCSSASLAAPLKTWEKCVTTMQGVSVTECDEANDALQACFAKLH